MARDTIWQSTDMRFELSVDWLPSVCYFSVLGATCLGVPKLPLKQGLALQRVGHFTHLALIPVRIDSVPTTLVMSPPG